MPVEIANSFVETANLSLPLNRDEISAGVEYSINRINVSLPAKSNFYPIAGDVPKELGS